LLITPTAWFHYEVLLLLPFALLATAANRAEASFRATWLGLLGFGLTNISERLSNHMSGVVAYYLMTTMAVWVSLAYLSSYFLLTDECQHSDNYM
jgi:hypothetical protein